MIKALICSARLVAVALLLAIGTSLASGATITVRAVSLENKAVKDEFPGVTVRVIVRDATVRGNERFLFEKDIDTRGDTITVPDGVVALELVFDDKGANVLEQAILLPILNATQSITVVMPEKKKSVCPPCNPVACMECPPAIGGCHKGIFRRR